MWALSSPIQFFLAFLHSLFASPPSTLRILHPTECLPLSVLSSPFSSPLLYSLFLSLVARLEKHNAGIIGLILDFFKCHRKCKQVSGRWKGLGLWRWGMPVGTQGLKCPWLRGSCRDPVRWQSHLEGASLSPGMSNSSWAATHSPIKGEGTLSFKLDLTFHFLLDIGYKVRVHVVILC